MSNLEAALKYASKGKPVFPCKRDKRPITKNGFKNATTDEAQIKEWWTKRPTASIGMPTGHVSGLWVLDIDMPDGSASLAALEKEYGALPETLIQETGSGGGQLFFKCTNGDQIKNSSSELGKNLDVRGDGGYVIVPPSGHPSGKKYQWLSTSKAVEAPEWLVGMVRKNKEKKHRPIPSLSGSTKYGMAAMAQEIISLSSAGNGERNDQLNRSAYSLGQLVAGGQLDHGHVSSLLVSTATGIGLTAKEAECTVNSGMKSGALEPRYAESDDFSAYLEDEGDKVDSGGQWGTMGDKVDKVDKVDNGGQSRQKETEVDRRRQTSTVGGQKSTNGGQLGDSWGTTVDKADTAESSLMGAVKAWIMLDKRTFRIADLYNEMNIRDRQQKKTVSKYLSRYCDEGLIERVRGQRGVFSYKESSLSFIDYLHVDREPVDSIISLPLGLEGLGVQIHPGNIIVVAGESNAGKTSVLLNIAHDNLKAFGGQYETIRYFSSEMGPQEMHTRVKAFGEPLSKWKGMQAIERSQAFHQIIDPDGLNIIDFMEVHNEFYLVGEWIRYIHETLKDGVCVIAIQKKSGTDFGRSGEISLEKPRLYLSISECVKGFSACKIIKAKNYVAARNPNGLEKDFRITGRGSKLEETGGWRYMTKAERNHQNAQYESQLQLEAHDFTERSIPNKATAFEYEIDGSNKRITFETLREWRKTFMGLDVDGIVQGLVDDHKKRPFLKKNGHIFQLAGILNKRYTAMGGTA
jgi:hypothetical protein